MADARLQEHYEQKYANEAAGVGRIVPFTNNPKDRFEAAVSVMHREFRGGDILEIGGGDGTIARSLIRLSFDSYTITDLSKTRAEAAAMSLSDERFRAFPLDIERDEVDGRYDAILMVALIEHLIDPIGAMRKVRSLLKPGGFVYLDTPNMAKWTRRVKLALGHFPSTASKEEGLTTYGGDPVDLYDEGHLHYWTFNSMRGMLTRYCGFSDITPAPYDFRLRSLARLWPEMFSELAIIAR